MAEKRTPESSRLIVTVAMSVGRGAQSPAVRVYLFDASGRLVTSERVKESVTLPIDPKQKYRVTVGPDFVSDRESVPADITNRLRLAGAVSRDFLPQAPVSSIDIHLGDSLVHGWLFSCMNIHGSVRKHLSLGGAEVYAPICTGTVQIFTIDLRASLGNLSDGVMLSLKDTLLAGLVGAEIADILSWNFADFAKLSTLAAGLFPLTGNALRDYVAAHRSDLATFMCNFIPEWAISYERLPDAPIQSDGTFSLFYCFLAWQAPPDVYFEVVQTTDGIEREISDPDIVCTTMWRYDGSRAAVITVEDQTAIACLPDPLPGPGYLYVWPTAIGNTPLSEIDGLETLTGSGLIPGGPIGTPWGGTLSLQVQFDPNLRANNIHYYRWSYRFAGDADFTQIRSTVTHRWKLVTVSGGMVNIMLNSVTLGPVPVGAETNLFEIPDPTLDWVDIVDPADRPFAYFDSTGGQVPGRSGMVTLKLEMFDSAGNHVSCGNSGHGGPFTFILPDQMGVNQFTDAPAPNIDSNGNLIFNVLVDNNPTTASFPGLPVHIGGSHADDCGILHYTSGSEVLTIDYVATHPNNFLSWNLGVTRGSHGGVAATVGRRQLVEPRSIQQLRQHPRRCMRASGVRGESEHVRPSDRRVLAAVAVRPLGDHRLRAPAPVTAALLCSGTIGLVVKHRSRSCRAVLRSPSTHHLTTSIISRDVPCLVAIGHHEARSCPG